MGENTSDIEYEATHKCLVCKYKHKCLRYQSIYKSLAMIEANALEKWNIDLDVTFLINDCERYAPDFNAIEALNQTGYEEGDSDE